MINSKHKGDIAIGQAIAFYTKNGFEVLLPIGDKREYDCVIERDGILERVQVKYAGCYKSGVCKVGLRITGGNQKILTVKKYSKNSFERLFVFTQSGKNFNIPWNEISARNELTIDDEKYIKYQVF